MDALLLDYISEVCRSRRISFVSPSTFEAWKSAAESIGRTGGSDAARRTAYLLSAVLDPDIADLRTRFGDEVATMVVGLVPKSADLSSRSAKWTRAAQQGGPSANAAVALLATEVATTIDGADAEVLKGYLKILGAKEAAATAIRDEAALLARRLEQSAPSSPSASAVPGETAVISMSIDMAGSTEAKTRMLAVAADRARCNELYSELYQNFLHHEHRLYSKLFDPNAGHGCVLDWKRLFVVKGIGDEIWILYEINPVTEDHLVSAAARLIYASLGLVGESIEWHGTERSSGPDTTPEEESRQRFDEMKLAYKVQMDLLVDALEISGIRARYVSGNVGQYLRRERAPFDADAAELANRLNAGQFDTMGRRVRRVFRTDYIGHEVDRFFRTAKAALPGIVTVGESLFRRLKATSKLVANPGLFHATVEYDPDPDRPGGMRRWWSDLLYAYREIPAADLKGIGYPYRVYHFADRPRLNGLWHRAATEKLIEPVLSVFPAELKDQLKTLAERASLENGDLRAIDAPKASKAPVRASIFLENGSAGPKRKSETAFAGRRKSAPKKPSTSSRSPTIKARKPSSLAKKKVQKRKATKKRAAPKKKANIKKASRKAAKKNRI